MHVAVQADTGCTHVMKGRHQSICSTSAVMNVGAQFMRVSRADVDGDVNKRNRSVWMTSQTYAKLLHFRHPMAVALAGPAVGSC